MNLTLNAGRDLVAIPGPSVVPDRVLSAMHRAMPNIYGGELIDVSNEVFERLPAIARTTGRPFVAIANGHGVWEMAISNTLSRGEQVLVLESGPFAMAWGEMAAFAGVKTEVLPAPERGPVDPAAVESRLRADVEPATSRPSSSPTSTPARRPGATSRPSAPRSTTPTIPRC